ncbi:hypothetical protein [Fulvivirga sp. M361]|uniref:hypothetical protein n=1 Tax=Fulvivirga sp. M361 TaxID=2594266 RepID=UPI00162A9796|nr:hypothetical protein [Fulvivirga sp. M361]
MNERIWNTEGNVPYEVFIRKLDQTDGKLSILVGDHEQDSLLYDHNYVAPDEH